MQGISSQGKKKGKMPDNNRAQYQHPNDDQMEVGVTKKRYLILFLFSLYSMSNAFQWIEYAIITNVISDFYSVSNLAVNWTSVIYMALYIPGIVPASWLLNRKGLRFCVLLGSFGTCLGAWIKCLSISPDRFWLTMIGQTVVASSQLFILNIPPRLAAVWFGAKEVSSATSFGVFGNQVGIALGFVLPPLLFRGDDHSKEFVAKGLSVMFFTVAIICTALLFLKLLFFDDTPRIPPSTAAAKAQDELEQGGGQSYPSILKSLFTNRNYNLLFLTYGLNVGVFYAISTVLNQLVELRFPGHSVEAGFMGLIITVSGVFGSIVCGIILDKTHRFKATTLLVYVFSLVGMIAFSYALTLTQIWPLFFVSGLLGFFMTGYLPIGFEFAAEISYPNPEGTSAGLLNAAAQVCIIITCLRAK
jgi:FLVCR family feline leukemia virus subgroup C receptor-related protein